MYVYASKILPYLFMPLSICGALIFLALLLILRDRLRIGVYCLILAFVVAWVSSMPLIAAAIYGRLEHEFPPAKQMNILESSCAVLLGGAVFAPIPPRVDIEFTESTDRVYVAAQLFISGKMEAIIVTAGNQPWSEPGPSEAALIGELLVEWGVPADALHLEGNSRNTRENALNTLPILKQLNCERPLLVTSAAHMPRALASFRVLGVDAIPVSTDVRVVNRSKLAVMDFLPSAQALAMTSDAIREWMGQKVYELRGWN